MAARRHREMNRGPLQSEAPAPQPASAHPWQQWREELTGWLLKRLGRHAIAEELAQEAMMRLWQAQHDGKEIKQPRSWLYRVAGNLAVDFLRRQLPMQQSGQLPLLLLVDPRSQSEDNCVLADTEAGEFDRAELLAELPMAMAGLPPEDRLMLWSRYQENLDCAAMAVREGRKTSTIKGRLFRARRRLRERILEQAAARRGTWS